MFSFKNLTLLMWFILCSAAYAQNINLNQIRGSSGLGVNNGAIILAQSCGTQTNCYITPANTQIVTDASFTSGSPTITTSTYDPPFSPSDVGKKAQATRGCGLVSTNPEKCEGSGSSGIGCPETTIAAYVSAHQVTLTSNCTNSSVSQTSVQNRFAWGNPDDTGIASAVAALEAQGHGAIYLPCTGMWVEQPAFQLVSPNASTTTRGPMSVIGCPSGTVIVPGFNFNYAGCPSGGGCIFHDNNVADNNNWSYAGGNEQFRDVDIQGLGIDCASGCSIGSSELSAIDIAAFQSTFNVHINGWNWDNAHFDAVNCHGGAVNAPFINAGGYNGINITSGGCNIFSAGSGDAYVNNGGGAALLQTAGFGGSHEVQYFADSSDGCSTTGLIDGVVQLAGELSLNGDSFSNFCGHTGTSFLTNVGVLNGGYIQTYNLGISIHAKGTYWLDTGNYTYFAILGADTLFDEGGNLPGLAPIIQGSLFGSASITGVAEASSLIVPNSNWGSGGTSLVSSVSGSAQLFTFTVTTPSSGQSASPTITASFPTFRWGQGFWATPNCSVQQTGGNDIFEFNQITATSTTAVTWTWLGTPNASKTYIFTVSCKNS